MDPIRFSGIRAVVFDLDDTLYAERAYAHSGFAAVARWLQARYTCPLDLEQRMRALYETEYRPRVFDRLLVEMGLSPSAGLVSQMVECYRSHRPVIGLYPDADAALDRWSGRFRLGLISDGPVGAQQRKVEVLGVASRIDRIILTDEWGREYWKPHPRAFLAMEEYWGWHGGSLLYIADNPSKDFLAPRRLGWRTLRVCRAEGVYAHLPAVAGAEAEQSVSALDLVEVTF
ncbi:MAG TPA: HAD family hydrolase [Phycisphaerae bacterium]|nr:HAD family hydrolase [Phycisphaerae bacterium]HRY69221.1 HAD family hydrolase [Phycisphaerae bacterium]HSA26182.1 HAD family hydrolase [Phycisphaerae bacterium]